jgi:hypothetical protein
VAFFGGGETCTVGGVGLNRLKQILWFDPLHGIFELGKTDHPLKMIDYAACFIIHSSSCLMLMRRRRPSLKLGSGLPCAKVTFSINFSETPMRSADSFMLRNSGWTGVVLEVVIGVSVLT